MEGIVRGNGFKVFPPTADNPFALVLVRCKGEPHKGCRTDAAINAAHRAGHNAVTHIHVPTLRVTEAQVEELQRSPEKYYNRSTGVGWLPPK